MGNILNKKKSPENTPKISTENTPEISTEIQLYYNRKPNLIHSNMNYFYSISHFSVKFENSLYNIKAIDTNEFWIGEFSLYVKKIDLWEYILRSYSLDNKYHGFSISPSYFIRGDDFKDYYEFDLYTGLCLNEEKPEDEDDIKNNQNHTYLYHLYLTQNSHKKLST